MIVVIVVIAAAVVLLLLLLLNTSESMISILLGKYENYDIHLVFVLFDKLGPRHS